MIKSKQNTELLCKVILVTYTNSQFVILELILVEREGCDSWDKPKKSKILDTNTHEEKLVSQQHSSLFFLTPNDSYPGPGC